MKGEAAIKAELMRLEFNLQMQIQGAQQQSIDQREQKEKTLLVEYQANSEQSKLIEQRKNNLPPIKFESNEDSLDGFDLELSQDSLKNCFKFSINFVKLNKMELKIKVNPVEEMYRK